MPFVSGLSVEADGEEPELDGLEARIAMLGLADLAANLGFDAELLAKLAAKRRFRRFAGFELAAGELPFARLSPIERPAADERASAPLGDSRGDADH